MTGRSTRGDEVLARLKTDTRAEHEAIEQTLALMGSKLTTRTYRRRLEQFYGFYRPLEDGLAAIGGWSARDIDLSARGKVHLLTDDLAALEGPDPSLLPICSRLPRLLDAVDGFGCLYVLEGATLGGQILSRHLRDTLGITPDTGGRFFHGYGERTADQWRSFRRALGAFVDAHAAEDQMVSAAADTFRTLRLWCEARGST